MLFNEAQVSLIGYVATQPRWRLRGEPNQNLTMRVAWTTRRLDKATGEWADGHTSYVSVYCWRKVAENVATCVRKGDPVLVRGRLTVREYTDKDGVPRTAVEIDASTMGHDLGRGVARFQRTRPATGLTADEHAAEVAGLAGDRDGATAGGADGVPAGGYGDGAAGGYGDAPGDAQDGGAATGAAAENPAADEARSGDEIFNTEAIGALAAQADGAAVPF
jgi:single-strand DNA-binding protein